MLHGLAARSCNLLSTHTAVCGGVRSSSSSSTVRSAGRCVPLFQGREASSTALVCNNCCCCRPCGLQD